MDVMGLHTHAAEEVLGREYSSRNYGTNRSAFRNYNSNMMQSARHGGYRTVRSNRHTAFEFDSNPAEGEEEGMNGQV